MSRRTLYRYLAAGKFPMPIQASGPRGKLRWPASVIEAWQQQDTIPAPAAPPDAGK